MDHVTPISFGGATAADNLALACFRRDRRKGNAVRAVGPDTQHEVSFFNPRADAWREHFVWSSDGLDVVPLTATGRATVQRLDLNRDRIRRIREADRAVRRHPPEGDPVQEGNG